MGQVGPTVWDGALSDAAVLLGVENTLVHAAERTGFRADVSALGGLVMLAVALMAILHCGDASS